jgi:hypothetical protein
MAGRNLSEQERRELANAHRGELADESGEAIEPRTFGQVVSIRLEADTVAALRDVANRRGVTLSDLLREGASMVLIAAEQVRPIMGLSFEVVQINQQPSSGSSSEHTTNPVDLDQPMTMTA